MYYDTFTAAVALVTALLLTLDLVDGAGISTTVTECVDCDNDDCSSSSIVCTTYNCDGLCRASSAATSCSGRVNHYNCKATTMSASTLVPRVGFDYYASSGCALHQTSLTYEPAICYPNGVGGSFYLEPLGVSYSDELNYWYLKPCLSGALCSDDAGTPLKWAIQVAKARPFSVSLPPRRQLAITVSAAAGTFLGDLVLRGNSDKVPTTANDATAERSGAAPRLTLDYCPRVSSAPDKYYFTVAAPSASSTVTVNIRLDLVTLTCATTPAPTPPPTPIPTPMPTPLPTPVPTLPGGGRQTTVAPVATTTITTTTLPRTTAAATTAEPPCKPGSNGCECRTLGQPCDAPQTCTFDAGVGAQRCQCTPGTVGCPCRSAAPECGGGGGGEGSPQLVCRMPERRCVTAMATAAPTPEPVLAQQRQCAAGNCTACIGCEQCLFGEQCGYCRATGLCVERVGDCSSSAAFVVGNWRSACGSAAAVRSSSTTTTTSLRKTDDETEAMAMTMEQREPQSDIVPVWIAPVVIAIVLALLAAMVGVFRKYLYFQFLTRARRKIVCRKCLLGNDFTWNVQMYDAAGLAGHISDKHGTKTADHYQTVPSQQYLSDEQQVQQSEQYGQYYGQQSEQYGQHYGQQQHGRPPQYAQLPLTPTPVARP